MDSLTHSHRRHRDDVRSKLQHADAAHATAPGCPPASRYAACGVKCSSKRMSASARASSA